MAKPSVSAFFDGPSNTISYLVADPESGQAAVVDPVLDYDPASGTFHTASARKILAAAAAARMRIIWVLETHVHADHISAAPVIARHTGARIGIGEQVRRVQRQFIPIFDATDLRPDGSVFDHLFADDETFRIGTLEARALHTPGHSPDGVSFLIGDAVFVGDTLFMPDFGTARADFPGGDARALYRSIKRLLALPPETRAFMCHDYKAPGRTDFAWETTIGEECARNVHVRDGISEQAFVTMREARDAELPSPKMLLPAIQMNMRAGQMPPADARGQRFLKIPISAR